MRTPNYWIDPATGITRAWPVNHSSEEPIKKTRQMADGAPTSNIGLIPQQGAATPLIFTWKGSIFDPAVLDDFLAWWKLCDLHSIYLVDYRGHGYEVLITEFEPSAKGVARNPKFPDLPYIWEYTIVMRVLTAFSGPWAGVTP